MKTVGSFTILTNRNFGGKDGNVVIDDGVCNTLTLNGVNIADLDSGDFIF